MIYVGAHEEHQDHESVRNRQSRVHDGPYMSFSNMTQVSKRNHEEALVDDSGMLLDYAQPERE